MWFRNCLQILMLAAMCLTAVDAAGQEERPDLSALPRLEQMKLPSLKELKDAYEKDAKFDWLVFNTDQAVLVINAVYPRPDTLKKMEEERKELEAQRPSTPEARDARSKRLKELSRVNLTLPGDITDYQIAPGVIEQIILFEDLVLQRADQLIESGDIRDAYELILMVEREIPGWEKTAPRFERLLLAESQLKADAGDIYAALALLDELAVLNISNPELQPRFGAIVDRMISDAAGDNDFRKARYLMARLQRHFPNHPLLQQRTAEFSGRSAEILADASKAAQQRDFRQAASLAYEAERIWPTTGNARATFTQLVSRYQVLRVAVETFSGHEDIFPVEDPAEQRHHELISVPLFEASSVDELTYYRSSFFERWDPSDLGREVTLTVRDTRPHWQSQPLLTANQIADGLSVQLDAESPLFNARLASFVSRFSVRSPTELKLHFVRVPLNMEALFRFPVQKLAAAGADEQSVAEQQDVLTPDAQSPDADVPVEILSTRFELVSREDDQRIYRRRIPEPDGLDNAQYHVAEVIEKRFPSRHLAIQALNRGEVDYLPSVLPWEIDGFRAAESLVAVRRAIPATHVITFNPRSGNVASAQIRRALSLAIDRAAILRSVVLRDSQMKHGRPSSSVWRQASYATNPIEDVPRYDLRLAFALRFAAERQLQITELQKLEAAAREKASAAREEFNGDEFRKTTSVDYIKLPALRMIVAPDPAARAAAERILVYWKKIGMEVQLIDGGQQGEAVTDADWDLMYRQVHMEEPLLDLWPVLTNDPQMDVSRLQSYPDWMRQELINLDYAGSFVEAQRRLHDIHRHMAAQAFIIPLWEVDEYAVFQKTVSGIPASPISTYHNFERWTVRP